MRSCGWLEGPRPIPALGSGGGTDKGCSFGAMGRNRCLITRLIDTQKQGLCPVNRGLLGIGGRQGQAQGNALPELPLRFQSLPWVPGAQRTLLRGTDGLPTLALHAYQAGPLCTLPALDGPFSRPWQSISAHSVGHRDSMGPLFPPVDEAESFLIFTVFLITEPCLELFSWPRFPPCSPICSHVSTLRSYSSFRGCVMCSFLQEVFLEPPKN